MKRSSKAPRGTLTMDRKGEFTVKTMGNSHCGLDENLTIKYAVSCECEVSLDDRGFLFDQISVDNYFKSHKKTAMSCERFAIACARDLWKLILEENEGCIIREMKLTLSPAPHLAAMTFCYNVERDGKRPPRVKA